MVASRAQIMTIIRIQKPGRLFRRCLFPKAADLKKLWLKTDLVFQTFYDKFLRGCFDHNEQLFLKFTGVDSLLDTQD